MGGGYVRHWISRTPSHFGNCCFSLWGKKLPELGHSLGKAVGGFKKGLQEETLISRQVCAACKKPIAPEAAFCAYCGGKLPSVEDQLPAQGSFTA